MKSMASGVGGIDEEVDGVEEVEVAIVWEFGWELVGLCLLMGRESEESVAFDFRFFILLVNGFVNNTLRFANI